MIRQVIFILLLFGLVGCAVPSENPPPAASPEIQPASTSEPAPPPVPTFAPTPEPTAPPPSPAPEIEPELLPEGFVYVTDIIPDAILDMRYYSGNNFIGTRIDGYEAPAAILTEKAAYALKQAADILREQGYSLKIFDAYMPQSAVNHFIRWAGDPEDTVNKEFFYPDIDKMRKAMEEAGFKAYSKEWWHYSLAKEPYPDTYFDFSVK